jgi:predicted DNA-binding transcriptional regulator AlpA
MNSNIVLSKNEAATQLKISIQTLDKMFKRGELPRIQLTMRRVGVLQSDITQHLENRRAVA